MIKLGGLVTLKPITEVDMPKFTAINKDSGKTSVFSTKDARDAAIKAGTHEKRKTDKDGKDGDDKKDTPKVNIFKRDSDKDSKERLKKMKKDREEKEFNSLYNSDDFDEKVDSLKDKMSDKDFKEIKDAIENLKYMQYDLEDIDRDEDNEEWAMQSDAIDVEVEDLKGVIKQAISKDKEEPKKDDGPVKDSTGGRAGNPEVNKAVRKKAEKIGLTPQKLGREEYELRMVQAAHEALTDSNFHSEARKLIAIIEDNPELEKNPANDPNKPGLGEPGYEEWQKGTAWGSKYGDSSEGTDELGQAAAQESGWAGKDALDGIAFELKMRGFKDLAAKIQSVFDDEKNESTKLGRLIPEGLINEGTRSQVGIIDRSGKIASAYVHYDGYPSNMKPGLKKHMKNEKDVLKLIKMGGARGIFDDKEIEYYKSGKPTKGNMKDFGGYVDAADRNGMAEYVYLYNMKDKKWYFADVYGDKKLKKLF